MIESWQPETRFGLLTLRGRVASRRWRVTFMDEAGELVHHGEGATVLRSFDTGPGMAFAELAELDDGGRVLNAWSAEYLVRHTPVRLRARVPAAEVLTLLYHDVPPLLRPTRGRLHLPITRPGQAFRCRLLVQVNGAEAQTEPVGPRRTDLVVELTQAQLRVFASTVTVTVREPPGHRPFAPCTDDATFGVLEVEHLG